MGKGKHELIGDFGYNKDYLGYLLIINSLVFVVVCQIVITPNVENLKAKDATVLNFCLELGHATCELRSRAIYVYTNLATSYSLFALVFDISFMGVLFAASSLGHAMHWLFVVGGYIVLNTLTLMAMIYTYTAVLHYGDMNQIIYIGGFPGGATTIPRVADPVTLYANASQVRDALVASVQTSPAVQVIEGRNYWADFPQFSATAQAYNLIGFILAPVACGVIYVTGHAALARYRRNPNSKTMVIEVETNTI